MPSRVCGDCTLDFPLRQEYITCPKCGVETNIRLLVPPTAEWEAKLDKALSFRRHGMDDADAQLVLHRVRYLRKLGYSYDQATVLAARYSGADRVDVHDIEDLVVAGASLQQAARIV